MLSLFFSLAMYFMTPSGATTTTPKPPPPPPPPPTCRCQDIPGKMW